MPDSANETIDTRLVDLFTDLCAISSPSGDERAVADYLIARITDMGLSCEEDDAHTITGGNAGNIMVRLAPDQPGDMTLLCSHMDTVPPTDTIIPIERDGYITNANETILGGDNKAAVAVMLMALEQCAAGQWPHAGLEVLFTVCEETGLVGAGHVDTSSLESSHGFVYDHANEIGRFVVQAPTHLTLNATFNGTSAHSGIAPEDGRNAIAAAGTAVSRIKVGRIDAESTANIGTIRGGTAGNVVPDLCTISMEARSQDALKANTMLDDMVEACTQAAAEHGCTVSVEVNTEYLGYSIPDDSPMRAITVQALTDAGYTPEPVPCGGGSDANVFNVRGFPCLNICNAMEKIHTAEERIAIGSLTGMLRVTEGLVRGAVASDSKD